MKITWHDAGREPRNSPDPAYPHGIDLNFAGDAAATCTAVLPYPARRCGYYLVECQVCRQRIVITTAGRVDDPRTVKIACKLVQPGH